MDWLRRMFTFKRTRPPACCSGFICEACDAQPCCPFANETRVATNGAELQWILIYLIANALLFARKICGLNNRKAGK
jgi:hypothetical protein